MNQSHSTQKTINDMSETLKSEVLAKCGELQISMHDFNRLKIENGYFDVNLPMGYLLTGVNFAVAVGEIIDENDFVWPLAAQILGIAGKPKPRPSDDLLLKAYNTGYYGCGSIERFNNFLATLPPDPLADDRAQPIDYQTPDVSQIIKNVLMGRSLFKEDYSNRYETQIVEIDQDDAESIATDIVLKVKRLAGMEVNRD